MKKSLVYSEIFPPFHGGSGRWFWEVYKRLNVQEYVVLAGKFEQDEIFDSSSPLCIERVDFAYTSWSDWALTSLKSIVFYIKLFFTTRKIIKKHDIHNIHCGRCIPEGFIAYLMNVIYKTPYMCYIHGEDIESAAESRAFVWIVSKALKRANLLICNSENSKRLLLAHWKVDPARVQVVHPGVDTSVFVPQARNEDILADLRWQGKKVALTVSRLETRKGHDRMIEAIPQIVKDVPNFLYAIIGSGDEYQRLQALVEQLRVQSHVLFMANLSDQQMIQCYQQSDLFVLPNRDVGRNIEGFGIVMIEAQACGTAVISGNSGGTPETLLHGQTGEVVDCTVAENIANSVVALLNDDERRKTYQCNAREHALKYDWAPSAKRIETVCKQYL